MPARQDGFAFGRLIAAWRRRGWVVLLLTVVGASALASISLTSEKRYDSTASLLFRNPGFDQSVFGSSSFQSVDPTREAATNVRLVSLNVIAQRAADTIGSLTADDVLEMTDVRQEGQSDVVSITVRSEDPTQAARLANVFASEYVEFRREADRDKIEDARRLVQSDINVLTPAERKGEEGSLLREQISRLATLGALQTGNAEIVQEAEPADDPSSPKVARDVVLGGLLGLVLGLIAASLLERLDRRIQTVEEAEETLGLPGLAGVPKSSTLADLSAEPEFASLQALRMLRSRLRYFDVDRTRRSILITSAAPGDGKTTISAGLALTAARLGARTILLETDLHHHSLSRMLNLPYGPGLADLLTHQAEFDDVLLEVPVGVARSGAEDADEHRVLDVIVGGSDAPNPAELIESQKMEKLLSRLEDDYDLVVIDSPPVGLVADTLPILSRVGGVVVVVRAGKTGRDDALRLKLQLEGLGADLLGIVVNALKPRKGHYSSYGYGAPAADASHDAPASTRA